MEFITNNFIALFLAGTGLLFVLLIILIANLQRKIKRLLGGGQAKSIEGALALQKKHLDDLLLFQKDSIEYYKNVENRLGKSIQSVETIRFNPFKGTGDGGNQSFSTTFLNEKGDGVVFSSLYSRERVSVFSKPVKKFKSEYDLTQEENETLEKAKQGLTAKDK